MTSPAESPASVEQILEMCNEATDAEKQAYRHSFRAGEPEATGMVTSEAAFAARRAAARAQSAADRAYFAFELMAQNTDRLEEVSEAVKSAKEAAVSAERWAAEATTANERAHDRL
jgi:hypothetical protein